VGSALQHKLKATVMMDRRNLLALMTTGLTGLVVAPVLRFPPPTSAAESSPPARTLKAVKRTLDIKGKAASVYGLVRDDGGHGLILEPGQSFNVALTNQLSEQTLIHWHGLTPPWPMDGVPDVPAPLMKPGETRTYAFPIADPGTYWMHAHTLQEQNLLAAPLIVRSASDVGKDEQEVVVLLHDFSFTPAEELLARLTKGRRKSGMSMSGMGMGGMAEMMAGMSHDELMKHMTQMRGTMPGMRPAGMTGAWISTTSTTTPT
jgi:FtsP/CotA-like multicopper oxidase with cupredoxin domain